MNFLGLYAYFWFDLLDKFKKFSLILKVFDPLVLRFCLILFVRILRIELTESSTVCLLTQNSIKYSYVSLPSICRFFEAEEWTSLLET